jgi:hypothetical protein
MEDATGMIWSTQSKIFTICSFMTKVGRSLQYNVQEVIYITHNFITSHVLLFS